MLNFRSRILKILLQGVVFPKNMQKLLTKFPGLATFGRYNSAMITDCQKFIAKMVQFPVTLSDH